MSISGGVLHLSEPERPRGTRMAIDFFLRSLADDQGHRAVGVILSGSGTDGTLGVKAIKAAGGFVIAQEPTTAEFPSMPRSAIESGTVDQILPPEEISEVLVRYAQHPYVCDADHAAIAEPEEEMLTPPTVDDLSQIIALLRKHANHDFRSYKERTLVRRTRRRMCLFHIDDYESYVTYLRAHPGEIEALARDLLISVTDFFRDLEAWETLQQLAIEPIVINKAGDEAIRIWTCGCATGEEPYTVAMLVLEELSRTGKNCALQIFASDIDKEAVDFARIGRYPKSIAADVTPDRLKRFFTTEDDDDYCHVNKSLRESVVFADQNLIADPPFSKLDLICCRNLLIYLKADIQEKIIALFHFSLQKGGVLFLGSAETIGRQTDLFQTLDKRWRIFRRIGATQHDRIEFPLNPSGPHREIEHAVPRPQRREARLTHLAQQRLLDLLAPSAVLIDRNWRILFISGHVDTYLTHKAGVPTENLLDKARQGLRTKLRGVVHAALTKERTVSVEARVRVASGYKSVKVTVRIVKDREQDEALALVVFEEQSGDDQLMDQRLVSGKKKGQDSIAEPQGGSSRIEINEEGVIRQLEEELADAKDDLQSSIEQLESSNEEYRASNEEVMSINEELQSTNEELETSKEEMQSLNEELSTVNNQLAGKVDELETKHADLENLLAATDVPTLCLDTALAVRWFTPAAQKVIRLKPADKGRPLADVNHDFKNDQLVQSAESVLKNLSPIENEATCQDGRTYLCRLTPYRADDHRIGGVVITLVDISERKNAEVELKAAKELADMAIDTVRESILVLDAELRVVSANRSFYDQFKVQPIQTKGQLIYELGNGQWDIPKLRDQLTKVEADNASIENYEVEHEFETIGRRVMLLNGRKIEHMETILLAIEDITGLRMAEQRREFLLSLSDTITGTNCAHEILLQAAQRLCSYFQCDCAAFAGRNKDASITVVAQQTVDQELPDNIVDLLGPKAAATLNRNENLIVSDVVHDMRLQGAPADMLTSLGIRALAVIPRWRDQQLQAALLIGRHRSRKWDDQDVVLVRDAADRTWSAADAARARHKLKESEERLRQAAAADLGHVIERKRLERLIVDATEREQRRIGSDIHDGVGQELTGLRYVAQTHAEALLEQALPDATIAQRIADGLETVQKQIRSVIRDLVPVEFDENGLFPALRSLADRTTEAHDVDCAFECGKPFSIENYLLSTHIYRIAQEAVANAVRHSQANHITIKLNEDGGELSLHVVDDGVGIRDRQPNGEGFGLRSMKFRAELVGGHIRIERREAGGTEIQCTVPITNRN